MPIFLGLQGAMLVLSWGPLIAGSRVSLPCFPCSGVYGWELLVPVQLLVAVAGHLEEEILENLT